MSKFLSRLTVEELDDAANDGRGQWRLTTALVYQSDVASTIISVPTGFTTDFASVPRIPLVYEAVGDTAHAAAVVHDYLYSTGEVPRSMTDAIFKEAAQVSGISGWRSWILWAGVRIGGASRFKKTTP